VREREERDMRYIFIGVAAVLALLTGFVTLVAIFTANEVRGQIRRRTAELITLYDTFERPAAKREEGAEAAAEEARAAPELRSGPRRGASSVLRETEQIGAAQYLNAELPRMYKEIRSRFYVNPAQLLGELPIADIPRGEGGPATRLLRQIDHDTVFSVSELPSEDQRRILRESADGEATALLDEFEEEKESFDCIEFTDFLRLKASGEPRRVILYVPADMFNYRMFSEDTEVAVDADICDGVQIEADGLIYDFAIKGREIS
jgi:hypothetical protein